MQIFHELPPIVALLLGLVALAWAIYALLVPFMVDSIRRSTRKTHQELLELRQRLDALSPTRPQADAPTPQGTDPSTPPPPTKKPEPPKASRPRVAARSRPEGRPRPPAKPPRVPPTGRKEPTISTTRLKRKPDPKGPGASR